PGREKKALEQVEDLIATAGRIPADTIIVSNEVGWGLVPPTPLGRRYRDLLGRANCAVAASAHEVYLVAAGIPLELKSLSRNRLR
ncbi:MAG TPA: bifunctional adenosylcobinamide kinase/adenosylcobinamide-phosphate guanylyltransferase, partial [Firmicutes bacterium]|nr:bifunctional adenosylcobinamide kinase/adenosylcobinamide-phosphate guanylyltransferase [Bacillota bacterium]